MRLAAFRRRFRSQGWSRSLENHIRDFINSAVPTGGPGLLLINWDSPPVPIVGTWADGGIFCTLRIVLMIVTERAAARHKDSSSASGSAGASFSTQFVDCIGM